ncbi:MAG: hypothetical protein MRERC_6c004 [Mycoplasmataceae bacterium RC_NB112A]|nr:MAG: hypothetical protein MRERC_13c004 [Mycoplasmataceae bacterium RC_NB112A]KLL01926.1 MAG: hypothetical protein MRERC_6c004 [Mycoplasmataceae bacterium RC_NB112A]
MDSTNNSSYHSYSIYNSSTSSNSGSSISNWLKEWQERRDKQRSEDLAESQKRYIQDLEFKLNLKNIFEQKLNSKLKVSNWHDQINQTSDDYESWSRKFNMDNLIEKLSREYTCARWGAVKDDYFP